MNPQSSSSNLPRFFLGPILVFSGFIFITLLLGKFLLDDLRNRAKLEAQHHIEAVGVLKASQIHDWLDGRYAEARVLADNSFFAREATLWMREGARDDARRRQLASRFQSILKAHHYRSIVLYDASGRVALSAGEHVPDVQERKEDAHDVASSCQSKFIDLHRYSNAGLGRGMGFMSPISEGDICSGTIYLVEDPAGYLFPLIHYWPNESETAETLLVRIEGDQILFLDKPRYRSELPMEFRLPLDTPGLAAAIALRGKQGLLGKARDYRAKAVLSYATAIAGTPWVLLSKIDEDEAYQVVDQAERAAVILLCLVFGSSGIWLWQWRRRLLRVTDAALLKERARADVSQKEYEKRFRNIFENIVLPIGRISLTGEFVEVNDAWCNMFGYSRSEVLSRHLTWQRLTHPDDVESSASLVKRMLAGEIAEFKTEKRYLHKDGKVLWGSVQVKLVRDENGAADFIVSSIQDVSERKQAEKMINFMAYHDKLTSLPNRALLFDRLSQAMSQAKRDNRYVALLFVDLDGFKAVNDKYGHEAGDHVLKMAAQRFLACVRAVDTVARFGGDEFAIILGNLEDPLLVKGVAEKIVHAFAHNLTLADGGECNVGASVGISIYPENGSAMDNLMAAADQAMYESKRRGKNTYTFYKEKAQINSGSQWFTIDDNHQVGVVEIDEQHGNLVYMVNRLNDALKNDESMTAILQMLDELVVATQHHFETESRYMTKYQYPDQKKHEDEHVKLLNETKQFKEQFNQGRELLVLQSIKDWLLGHIMYEDKKLGTYLTLHDVK